MPGVALVSRSGILPLDVCVRLCSLGRLGGRGKAAWLKQRDQLAQGPTEEAHMENGVEEMGREGERELRDWCPQGLSDHRIIFMSN